MITPRSTTDGRASRPTTVRLGDVPDEPGERLRAVQDRIALFGKVTLAIALVFVGLSLAFHFAGMFEFFGPGRGAQLTATAIAFLLWRVARSDRPLPVTALHVLDGAGTVGIALCMVLMGHSLALVYPWGFFGGTFAVFHLTMAHAILVPSTPARTLVITATCFLGLIVSQALLPPWPSFPTAGNARWLGLLGPIAWSSTVTMLATVASRVIYGLEEKVIEARRVGQYTLEEPIGAGGMGEVYRASHVLLRRPTAIKLLAGKFSDREARRFEREVQLTARLTHPNTISIFDYGHTPDGRFYYAMELLEGISLEQLIEEHGAQPPARVIHILIQICGALREAHGAGLIHRDIKPANVFLCRRGGVPDVAKVLDFGLVKEIQSSGGADQSSANVILGTPLYMSPESILSPDGADARSDLYSLGALAYYLLSATTVFSGESVVEICGRHLYSAPEPFARRAAQPVPEELERIVLACLAKEPAARPASAEELAARLRACDGAGAWGESEAEAWWQKHLPRGRFVPVPAAKRELRTILVDLDERRRATER